MKLLLDANLSWRLSKRLQVEFPETKHVSETSLAKPASDDSIWEYAENNDYVIATNDDDFLRLSLSKGFPPKVVLLKTGNQSTTFIHALLIEKKSTIERLVESENIGIIELY